MRSEGDLIEWILTVSAENRILVENEFRTITKDEKSSPIVFCTTLMKNSLTASASLRRHDMVTE